MALKTSDHPDAFGFDDASGNKKRTDDSQYDHSSWEEMTDSGPAKDPFQGMYSIHRWLQQLASGEPWIALPNANARKEETSVVRFDTHNLSGEKTNAYRGACFAQDCNPPHGKSERSLSAPVGHDSDHRPPGKADSKGRSVSRADSCQKQ